MSALIARIRAEFATTSEVQRAADRWHELSPEYDRHPCHSPERRAVGAQIAVCVEEIADGITASKLASWVGFIADPNDLRRDAAGWRNGDVMGEGVCPHGL